MKAVRSAFRNDVHHRAGRAAVLGRKLIRDEAYFLDDIWIVDGLLPAGDARIVAVLAIDHEVVGSDPHAIHRVAILPGVWARRKNRLSTAELADARCRKGNGKHIAIGGKRQLGDAFGVKHHTDFRVVDVEWRRIRFDHGHRLRDSSYLQCRLDDGVLIECQNDSRPDIFGEAGLIHRDFIRSDRQVEYAKPASLV